MLDLVREVRPPFSPEAVVDDFDEVLHRYRVSQVRGDRYGGERVAEAFRKAQVVYRPAGSRRATSTERCCRALTPSRWSP